MKKISDI